MRDATSDRFAEYRNEVFLVLSIGAIAHGLGGFEIPVFVNGYVVRSDSNEGGGGNREDVTVGSAMGLREERQPARQILFRQFGKTIRGDE